MGINLIEKIVAFFVHNRWFRNFLYWLIITIGIIFGIFWFATYGVYGKADLSNIYLILKYEFWKATLLEYRREIALMLLGEHLFLFLYFFVKVWKDSKGIKDIEEINIEEVSKIWVSRDEKRIAEKQEKMSEIIDKKDSIFEDSAKIYSSLANKTAFKSQEISIFLEKIIKPRLLHIKPDHITAIIKILHLLEENEKAPSVRAKFISESEPNRIYSSGDMTINGKTQFDVFLEISLLTHSLSVAKESITEMEEQRKKNARINIDKMLAPLIISALGHDLGKIITYSYNEQIDMAKLQKLDHQKASVSIIYDLLGDIPDLERIINSVNNHHVSKLDKDIDEMTSILIAADKKTRANEFRNYQIKNSSAEKEKQEQKDNLNLSVQNDMKQNQESEIEPKQEAQENNREVGDENNGAIEASDENVAKESKEVSEVVETKPNDNESNSIKANKEAEIAKIANDKAQKENEKNLIDEDIKDEYLNEVFNFNEYESDFSNKNFENIKNTLVLLKLKIAEIDKCDTSLLQKFINEVKEQFGDKNHKIYRFDNKSNEFIAKFNEKEALAHNFVYDLVNHFKENKKFKSCAFKISYAIAKNFDSIANMGEAIDKTMTNLEAKEIYAYKEAEAIKKVNMISLSDNPVEPSEKSVLDKSKFQKSNTNIQAIAESIETTKPKYGNEISEFEAEGIKNDFLNRISRGINKLGTKDSLKGKLVSISEKNIIYFRRDALIQSLSEMLKIEDKNLAEKRLNYFVKIYSSGENKIIIGINDGFYYTFINLTKDNSAPYKFYCIPFLREAFSDLTQDKLDETRKDRNEYQIVKE